MIKLFNTPTRKIEEFQSIEKGKVRMYTCGPTVYNFMHIGNLRTFALSDLLFRVLESNGYEVKSIQNITDIDDKIVKRAREENKTISEVSQEFTQAFLDDISRLNINWKASEHPRATDYISAIAQYVRELLDKGFAYKEKDGSVYFDISKFPNYGRLSRIEKDKLKTGTRVLSDEYTKDDVQDFALWKAVPNGEIGSFESELGWGRPGWHIECSVMSQKTLGDTFDIHVGGVDLIFPHHENEIAQSEAKTGKEFVRFFIHGEHVLVDGRKMSKSLGNYYILKDLEKRGFEPLALRYLFLTAHYRDKLNFTWESLGAAQNAFDRLLDLMSGFSQSRDQLSGEKSQKLDDLRERFMQEINNDLGTPAALAVLWEVVKSNIPNRDKIELLISFDEVLGLDLVKNAKLKVRSSKIPKEVTTLLTQREKLRKDGKWEEADKIKEKIEEMGYIIEDMPSGVKLKKKRVLPDAT